MAEACGSRTQILDSQLPANEDVAASALFQLESNWSQAKGTSSLAAARQLSDYVRLARVWETEASELDQLSQAAGGLTNGLPKDVVDGARRAAQAFSDAFKKK